MSQMREPLREFIVKGDAYRRCVGRVLEIQRCVDMTDAQCLVSVKSRAQADEANSLQGVMEGRLFGPSSCGRNGLID